MNQDFWIGLFREMMTLMAGAVILAAGCVLVSRLASRIIETLTGSTSAGYFTYGALLATLFVGSITLVRRHS